MPNGLALEIRYILTFCSVNECCTMADVHRNVWQVLNLIVPQLMGFIFNNAFILLHLTASGPILPTTKREAGRCLSRRECQIHQRYLRHLERPGS